jgi:membrane protein YdbS with pleckstrin-like domain
MAISREKRIAFLKQRQLFRGMEEADIGKIADRMGEHETPANNHLLTHGDRGRTYYIIYRGKVRVWRKEENQEVELAILESGDEFGEEALLYNRPRSASVTAMDDCHFLTMDLRDFNWMLRTYPDIKLNIQAIAESHQQARKYRFYWLNPGEVVYLIARRHLADLFFDATRPLAMVIVGLFFLLLTSIPGLTTLSFILGFGLIGVGVLWIIYEVIDWHNDFFIITNQRVVWLEQQLLQSASRQEVPMAAIQSVNVETSQISRIMGYGDVLVRTFTGTGSLKLTSVDKPKQFRDLVEELLIRVREKSEEIQSEMMRDSIREVLGLTPTHLMEPPPPEEEEPEEEPKWVIPFLRTREVRGDEITYHKHWLVLLAKTWFPVLVVVTSFILTIFLYVNNLTLLGMEVPLASAFVFLGGGSLISVLAIGYHYLDWKNDIYKLTREKIIDSERKPLGREVTKSAPIRNIISIEHTREGLIRLIFNFGQVNIVVADTKLSFYNVHNPAQVQMDVFHYQERLARETEEAEAEKDRVQMSEWLKSYHEIWTSEEDPLRREDSAEET